MAQKRHSFCSCKPWTVYCSATMWCEEPTGSRLPPLHRRQCTGDLMEFITHQKMEKHPHRLDSTNQTQVTYKRNVWRYRTACQSVRWHYLIIRL
ncbi:hypothetical protein QQF64_011746 [Cirrhinus molitorella]|uniref:Secreted protein n=1 Tax=Cirrhinus molitorella TaxID=172907 RepID=A0ABR3LVT6_9TELE